MLRLALALATLLGLLGAAAALSERPAPRATLVFSNSGDLNTLDIHRMTWLKDLRIAGALFEGLVALDVFTPDLAIRPAVAERWSLSPDRLTYTFHLRPAAKWSDGAPVVAADFIRTFMRGSLPDIGPDYANLFELIRGVRDWGARRSAALAAFAADASLRGPARAAAAHALYERTVADWHASVGLSAPDDHTLIVTLERPTPYFLQVLTLEPFSPLRMDVVGRYQSVDAGTGRLLLDSGWTRVPHLVSNGPFVLAAYRFKRDLRLERNPHYWNAASVHVESIACPAADDPTAQVLAYLSGATDWVADVSAECKRDLWAAKRAYQREHADLYASLVALALDPVAIDRRMPSDPRQNIHAFPAFGTYFFNYMCSPALPDGRANPFADARIRRAFSLAVDRAAVSAIRGVDERPASTLIPPGSIPGYRSPAGTRHDPVAARALLAEAGFPGGRGLPTIEILVNKDSGHDLVAQSLARDWQRELGATVAILVKEIRVFREDLRRHNFMVSRSGWFGDYTDPTTFLDTNRTGDGNNDRLYTSPRFDALLDAAAGEGDPAARLRHLEEAERILVDEDCPFIPLVQYSQVFLFDPHRVSGISPHTRQRQILQLVDVLGDGRGSETPLELPAHSVPAANLP